MTDPLIEEIHKIRENLWALYGHDWKAIAKHFKDRSAQHPEQAVTRAQLRIERPSSTQVEVF